MRSFLDAAFARLMSSAEPRLFEQYSSGATLMPIRQTTPTAAAYKAFGRLMAIALTHK